MQDLNHTIEFEVNESLLDKVQKKCFTILWRQRQAYNLRWSEFPTLDRIALLLRWPGMLVSLAGIMLTMFYLILPQTCPVWYRTDLFLLFFVVTLIFFYYLPVIDRKINRLRRRLFQNVGRRGCERMAKRHVAKARQAVPFSVRYHFENNKVTYSRGKNDEWHEQWQRPVKGYAVIATQTCLVFRKNTSIVPNVLIMFEDKEQLRNILQNHVSEISEI